MSKSSSFRILLTAMLIASIEEPALIQRILAHLKQHEPPAPPSPTPFAARAPPQHALF